MSGTWTPEAVLCLSDRELISTLRLHLAALLFDAAAHRLNGLQPETKSERDARALLVALRGEEDDL